MNDRLAPLELRRRFDDDDLNYLDYRAKAITGVGHDWDDWDEALEGIMALAAAVPKLTAELRQLRGAP